MFLRRNEKQIIAGDRNCKRPPTGLRRISFSRTKGLPVHEPFRIDQQGCPELSAHSGSSVATSLLETESHYPFQLTVNPSLGKLLWSNVAQYCPGKSQHTGTSESDTNEVAIFHNKINTSPEANNVLVEGRMESMDNTGVRPPVLFILNRGKKKIQRVVSSMLFIQIDSILLLG